MRYSQLQDLLDHSLTLNTRSAPLWLISVPLRRSSALARVICLDYSFVNEGEPLEEEKIFESVLSACEPTVVALSLDVPGPEHICGERFDHPTLASKLQKFQVCSCIVSDPTRLQTSNVCP